MAERDFTIRTRCTIVRSCRIIHAGSSSIFYEQMLLIEDWRKAHMMESIVGSFSKKAGQTARKLLSL